MVAHIVAACWVVSLYTTRLCSSRIDFIEFESILDIFCDEHDGTNHFGEKEKTKKNVMRMEFNAKAHNGKNTTDFYSEFVKCGHICVLCDYKSIMGVVGELVQCLFCRRRMRKTVEYMGMKMNEKRQKAKW